MASTSVDAAREAHDAEELDVALRVALTEAAAICVAFVAAHGDTPSAPGLTVRLGVGADEEPTFVFRLLLPLDEDFDAREFPEAEYKSLAADVNRRIAETAVESWPWLVTAGIKPPSLA